jgi:hypothetical protein
MIFEFEIKVKNKLLYFIIIVNKQKNLQMLRFLQLNLVGKG